MNIDCPQFLVAMIVGSNRAGLGELPVAAAGGLRHGPAAPTAKPEPVPVSPGRNAPLPPSQHLAD